MQNIYKHEQAKRDLVDHFVYLAESAGLDVAERFLTNAEASFNELALNPRIGPRIGAALTLRRPELSGMRKWRVTDFDNVLIFLQATP